MVNQPTRQAPRLATFLEELQGSGRYVFTHANVAALGTRSAAASKSALRRLKAKGRIVTPRRGFHVVVPAEYRTAGSPPASWFIDDFMRFLEQPYYVGLLSAAAIHGASHQQPMAFQVVTDRATRTARVGRVRIDFHVRRDLRAAAVAPLPTDTGTMQVATPESTAFDLVHFASAAGGWSNVATVLSELAEAIDPAALARLAPAFATSDSQRLGYLLEKVGAKTVADGLSTWLETRRHRLVLLSPARPRGRRSPDSRWRVIPNVVIELDG